MVQFSTYAKLKMILM